MFTRALFLYLAKNKMLNTLAQSWGGDFAVGKLIGGLDFNSSIPFLKELNKNGLSVTVDHLGEFVQTAEVAINRTEECMQTIQRIGEVGLDAQVSLKLTSLGLDFDENLLCENLVRILDTADQHQIMVTIDMEDERRCEKTLFYFKQFKQKYHYVSTVIQSYLYRSEQDLIDLNQYGSNIRIVKGAYAESDKVAFPNKEDVDENYKKLVKMHLLNGNFTAIATHDDVMIDYTKKLVKEHQIPDHQFEFQMLYGIRSQKQLELVKEGYKMRVYVPYGRDWYGYYMRRLAERPANISFALKGLFKR